MPAAAIVVGSVIAGGAAVYGGKKAASAAQRGADRATAESGRQFDLVRSDTSGQRAAGNSALDQLARLYGWAPPSQAAELERSQAPMLVGDTELPAGTTTKSVGNGWYEVHLNGQRIGTLQPGGPNGKFVNDTGADIPALFEQQRLAGQAAPGATGTGSPDMGAFFESPDYQFNLGQGQQAIDRSLAARGRSLSGAGVKEGVRFASGAASGEFNNFTQRLLQIAGLGSAGVQTSAGAGMTAAGQIGAAQQNAGNTRASAYMQQAEGVNNAAQGGISSYLLSQYLKQPATAGGGYGWGGPR